MSRSALLERLADRIVALERPHPTRVAIDGIDASGKTTLADALAALVRARGRSVVRASVDAFHHPRSIRYRRGRRSAEGYYLDSFDYDALERVLLRPLGPEGGRVYRTAVFDHRSDRPVASPLETAAADAVLLLDGIFLLRPELRPFWDYAIFLQVPFDVALERALHRAAQAGEHVPADLYRERVYAAQATYLERIGPGRIADVVVDNTDPHEPRVVGDRKQEPI